MTTIYLRHPRHGTKVATLELEAQHDESNGWERFDPDAQLNDTPEVGNVLTEPRRRGRPRLEASE